MNQDVTSFFTKSNFHSIDLDGGPLIGDDILTKKTNCINRIYGQDIFYYNFIYVSSR